MIDITEQNFEQEVLHSELPVVLCFHADWCGPCKQMEPVFQAVEERLAGRVKCGRIDTGAEKRLRVKFCVASLPTVSLVRSAETFIDVADGLMPADKIVEHIEEALSGKLDEKLLRKMIGT